MRLWKRRWFVLADYCLFYYKGEPRHGPLRALCAGGVGEVVQMVVFSNPMIGPVA